MLLSFHSPFLSLALRTSWAAGKSMGHDLVAPSAPSPPIGRGSRAEARQPKLRKIDSTVSSRPVSQTELQIFIHIRFFPLYRFRQEATGLHLMKRETAGKVAGNCGELVWWGNEVMESWSAGAMRQEVTEETEETSHPPQALLRVLFLPLPLCCYPYPSVLPHQSNTPRPPCRNIARSAAPAG